MAYSTLCPTHWQTRMQNNFLQGSPLPSAHICGTAGKASTQMSHPSRLVTATAGTGCCYRQQQSPQRLQPPTGHILCGQASLRGLTFPFLFFSLFSAVLRVKGHLFGKLHVFPGTVSHLMGIPRGSTDASPTSLLPLLWHLFKCFSPSPSTTRWN